MSAHALAAPGVMLGAAELIALRGPALNSGPSASLAALPGGFAAKRLGRGLEVADVREYVPGDDIRHLDAGTTARTGRPHIRRFQEDRDRIVLLIADFRPWMFWGVTRAFLSVAAAEALVLIGWQVNESGGRVGLMALTPDAPVIVPPRGRVRGMLDVIGGLVQAHATGLASVAAGQAGQIALDSALGRVERLAPAGAELIIASGFDAPGDGLDDRLRNLARRRTLRLLSIGDAGQKTLPPGLYPVRLPDGRRARVSLSRTTEDRPETERIGGHIALRIDAGDPVDMIARRLIAGRGTAQAA